MSEPVRVRSVEAVVQLSHLLDRFIEEMEPLLLSCERNADRTDETLADELSHRRRLAELCQVELEDARRDLRRCEEDADDDDDDADCSEYRAEVASARSRLRNVEAEVESMEQWSPRLSEAISEFRLQSQRLRQLLSTHGEQAQAFLRERLVHLHEYSHSSVPSADGEHSSAEMALSGVAGPPLTVPPAGFDPEQIQSVAAVLSSLPELRSEAWRSLPNANARLQALQRAEDGIAFVVGRPSLPVLPAQLGPGEFGMCDGDTIFVNSEYLEPEFLREMILTIVHEGRHAYQHFACSNPAIHPDAQQLADWQWNLRQGNYISYSENPIRYRAQPLEADAFDFEEVVMEEYLSQVSL